MRAESAHRPLLHVAAVTAGLASGAVHAAEWVATPSAGLSAHTQRNPYLQSDDSGQHEISTGLSTDASLELTRETERLSLALHPSFSIYRFPDKDQLDRDEEHLSASASWRAETSSWAGSLSAARDTTLTSELGNTGLTQGNLRHEAYEISFGPTWRVSERVSAQATLDSLINRYPGNTTAALQNYRYDSALVGMSYVLDDRATLSLSGAAGRVNNEGPGGHSDNASVMARAQYALSPVWSIGVGAGPSLTRVDESTAHGLVYNASLSRAFERAAVSLLVSRSQQPSGSAIITDLEQASLSFSGALAERLTGSLGASVSRRRSVFREFGVDLTRVRYTRVDANLLWRATPSWQIAAGIGNSTQQVGSFFVNDQTGRGYDVSLSVSWSGKPYVH